MEIKIIRSRRRRKTVSARLVKDMLVVSAPVSIPQERLQKIITQLENKIQRSILVERLNKHEHLNELARRINRDYFDNTLQINAISYVGNQNCKFGCCNYQTAHIRISHKVSTMPEWVKEYVVLHELAHLKEPNHSKAFWDIVNRYALTERARGYLVAVGMEQGSE